MIEAGQSPEDFVKEKPRWLTLIRGRYRIPQSPDNPYSEEGKAISKERTNKMKASLKTFDRALDHLKIVRSKNAVLFLALPYLAVK